nr:MAG TPA: hypothetical protein [Caudoviricetes sp.]
MRGIILRVRDRSTSTSVMQRWKIFSYLCLRCIKYFLVHFATNWAGFCIQTSHKCVLFYSDLFIGK